MISTNICKFFFSRQAAVKHLTKYEAIPHYMKENLRDPHDYKLRSMQQIKDDLKDTDGKFVAKIDVFYKDYNDAKFHESAMNKKVKMNVHLKNWKLTRSQKDRLSLLLGNRFMCNDYFTIICDQYTEPELNFEKLVQQVQELYLECKRAP
ncbi:hypothetical protein ABPG72_010339 [Tetrahymena utriculariae]